MSKVDLVDLKEQLDDIESMLGVIIKSNGFEDMKKLVTRVAELESSKQELLHQNITLSSELKECEFKTANLSKQNIMLLNSLEYKADNLLEYPSIRINNIKNNKIKIVIYIKEISKPQYINSFMLQLLYYMNKKYSKTKEKTKMVIFDTRKDWGLLYNPLPVVTVDNYAAKKDELLKEPILVYSEVNNFFLSDIVSDFGCEYLIVYDRTGKSEDLFKGQAVIKFYTLSSDDEFERLHMRLNDLEAGRIIMNKSSINSAIQLREIEDYSSGTTNNFYFSKYYKLKAYNTGDKTVFQAVLSKAGLYD